MKTILLTGYRGFIGSNLLKALTSKKYKVIKWEKEDYKENWELDLYNLFENTTINGVMHVGADANTLNTNVNEVMFLNYATTRFLSNICKYKEIPFIFSSSCAIYGNDGHRPLTIYGWSKKCAEEVVTLNGQVSLRYTNVYGPGESSKGGMASVAYQSWYKKLLNKPVTLFPGKPTRDFIYIADVTNANLHAYANYSSIDHRTYEVGSGESRPFEDVMNLLGIKFGYEKTNPISNYQNYTCSDKAKWMNGWAPKYNLEDGLKDYLKHLKK